MSRSTSASGLTLPLVEWRHDERRVVLPIRILPPSPGTDLIGYAARALLDTGSTASGLAPRAARQLNLIRRGKRPLGSVQGEGQAERYLFRMAMDIDSDDGPRFPYVFEEVEGFELVESFTLDALIGMDILSQCDFSMSRDGRCTLRFG